MEDTAHRAIAIVGAGSCPARRPERAAFLGQREERPLQHHRSPTRPWDPALYYDPDPSAPDKTYSKIGGWVREYEWDPMKWRLAIPPRVVDAMDGGQKWAVACTREALEGLRLPGAAARPAIAQP